MVRKQHFTLLYDRGRTKAFTSRNVLSSWSKTGLWPLNLDKILRDIPKLEQPVIPVTIDAEKSCDIAQLEQFETS
jgi:hypothetical protein